MDDHLQYTSIDHRVKVLENKIIALQYDIDQLNPNKTKDCNGGAAADHANENNMPYWECDDKTPFCNGECSR